MDCDWRKNQYGGFPPMNGHEDGVSFFKDMLYLSSFIICPTLLVPTPKFSRRKLIKKMFKVVILFSLLAVLINAISIDIAKINKCSRDANYPILVHNVILKNEDNSLLVSGSLITTMDLEPPIKAVVYMERFLEVWIPMPCYKTFGSCTYSDLCTYGIPNSRSCPRNFQPNNVPCRCPIKQGNYTIDPTFSIATALPLQGIFKGYYYAKIEVYHKSDYLTCYEIEFHYDDSQSNADTFNNNRIDDDIPFVEMV